MLVDAEDFGGAGSTLHRMFRGARRPGRPGSFEDRANEHQRPRRRLLLPVLSGRFTLTAEASYIASQKVMINGVDTSFEASSLLFGNLVAF